ncbi:Chaperone protein DnaJ [Thalassoglobus neptunius]|uniref:Chaperone protein DnaJ n=1 Tax=Thalassoglobus neptunius TaxID=1938619 RepID=A0A5C5W8S8_9PLAN|nr:J domain-containing protein [Thalassoglobus neptunius]TWT47014.1 Chaperone protein DnaJ [Thalassoglobus neptunius]
MSRALFDPYLILGVSQNATSAEIRRQYKKLVVEHHPDRNPQQSSSDSFKAVVNAYKILNNPEDRRKWDEQNSSPGNSSSRPSQRNSSRRPTTSPDELNRQTEFAELFTTSFFHSSSPFASNEESTWGQNLTLLVVVLTYGAMSLLHPTIFEEAGALFWGATTMGVLLIWLPDFGEDVCFGVFASPTLKILGWTVLFGFALFVWHAASAWEMMTGP